MALQDILKQIRSSHSLLTPSITKPEPSSSPRSVLTHYLHNHSTHSTTTLITLLQVLFFTPEKIKKEDVFRGEKGLGSVGRKLIESCLKDTTSGVDGRAKDEKELENWAKGILRAIKERIDIPTTSTAAASSAEALTSSSTSKTPNGLLSTSASAEPSTSTSVNGNGASASWASPLPANATSIPSPPSLSASTINPSALSTSTYKRPRSESVASSLSDLSISASDEDKDEFGRYVWPEDSKGDLDMVDSSPEKEKEREKITLKVKAPTKPKEKKEPKPKKKARQSLPATLSLPPPPPKPKARARLSLGANDRPARSSKLPDKYLDLHPSLPPSSDADDLVQRHMEGSAVLVKFANYGWWPAVILSNDISTLKGFDIEKGTSEESLGFKIQGKGHRDSYLVKSVPTGGDWHFVDEDAMLPLSKETQEKLLEFDGKEKEEITVDGINVRNRSHTKYKADLMEALLIMEDGEGERWKEWKDNQTGGEKWMVEEREKKKRKKEEEKRIWEEA